MNLLTPRWSAPQTWFVCQLEWIAASLGLDTETHTVGVHGLWTQSSPIIYFYLRPIERDSEWVPWLQGCERRGTGRATVFHEKNVSP